MVTGTARVIMKGKNFKLHSVGLPSFKVQKLVFPVSNREQVKGKFQGLTLEESLPINSTERKKHRNL